MIFGDVDSFRAQYGSNACRHRRRLRDRLQHFLPTHPATAGDRVHPIHGTSALDVQVPPHGRRTQALRGRLRIPDAGEHLRPSQAATAPDHVDSPQAAGLLVPCGRQHARNDEDPAWSSFGTACPVADHLAEDLIEYEEIEEDLLDEILGDDQAKRSPSQPDGEKPNRKATRRRNRRTHPLFAMGTQHRHRHQEPVAAQGPGSRLRRNGEDGSQPQGAHLHRIPPHPGLPQELP